MARHAAERSARVRMVEGIGVLAVGFLCLLGAVALGAVMRMMEWPLWLRLTPLLWFALVGVMFAVWFTGRKADDTDEMEELSFEQMVLEAREAGELVGPLKGESHPDLKEFHEEDR